MDREVFFGGIEDLDKLNLLVSKYGGTLNQYREMYSISRDRDRPIRITFGDTILYDGVKFTTLKIEENETRSK